LIHLSLYKCYEMVGLNLGPILHPPPSQIWAGTGSNHFFLLSPDAKG
jgi:hypothetical protein